MPRRLPCAALVALLATPVMFAAEPPSLTIYHADNDALFSASSAGTLNAGHALVSEQRQVELAAGTHELQIGDLPAAADPETMTVTLDPAAGVVLQGQQVRVIHPLEAAIGQRVDVFTSGTAAGAGASSLHGTLLGWGRDGGALIRTQDGKVHFVHRYASMTVPTGSVIGRSSLRLTVNAKSTGRRKARLTYMTSGLGWRAAYAATLSNGRTCRMDFKPEASVANRSGRDFNDATIKLVAGQPNLGDRVRMYSMARAPAPMAAAAMPEQASLGDYRSFTLQGAVNLPNGTVTLTPLYPERQLSCQREYIVDDGGSGYPPKPNTNDYGAQNYQDRPIASTLAFIAPDALPAGTLHAWTVDHSGAPALLGEGNVADTPKGQRVAVQLGQSFDLRASHERTAFHVDAKAHTMNESYKVTLSNGGDSARMVTVREHPNRWREWSVTSSSIKPSKQTPQLLEFRVPVPANGSTTLTYSVRYNWTAQDL
ncbi:MAG TPA: DUF4139 domain-containing protein [Rhodanobacteraceae bacterium]|nr:DUF4139 domain-containing protein [Rhodanobacteraceae bacterium]